MNFISKDTKNKASAATYFYTLDFYEWLGELL